MLFNRRTENVRLADLEVGHNNMVERLHVTVREKQDNED